MSADASNFLTLAFNAINDALSIFVVSFSSNLASAIAPVIYWGVIISFLGLGVMALKGWLDAPFVEVAFKIIKVSVITTLALNTAVFQEYIVDIFLTMPEDLMSTIIPGTTNTNVQTGTAATNAIEQMFGRGMSAAADVAKEGEIGVLGNSDLQPYLYAALILVGTVCCLIIGTFYLFVAKVVLAVMLAIAPLFICALLWQSTQQFFFSWVGAVFNTILSTVFVLAIFSIFITIFDGVLNQMSVPTEVNLVESAELGFIGLLCMAVLLELPKYVAQLTSAGGGSIGSALAKMAKGAGAAAGAAAGVVAGAETIATNAARDFKARNAQDTAYGRAKLRGASHETATKLGQKAYMNTKHAYNPHYKPR